jgi:hypothetical protein
MSTKHKATTKKLGSSLILLSCYPTPPNRPKLRWAFHVSEPSFFVLALCFVLMLGALCSVLMLSAYLFFWSSLDKHKARSMRTKQMASSSRAQFFLSLLCAHASCFVLGAHALFSVLLAFCFVLIGVFGHRPPSTKHEARSMSRVTLPRRSRSKRCDFEPKARSMSTKHKA